MSAMFDVHVLDKDEKKGVIKLELTIVHPDQLGFSDTKGFALMLLTDTIHYLPVSNPALFKEIPLEKILSFDFDSIKEKASHIIKKTHLTNVVNFPFSPELDKLSKDELRAFWSDKKRLPHAILTITVSDPAFISHLQKGQSWESGAFDVI